MSNLVRKPVNKKPVWVTIECACEIGGWGRTFCYELISKGVLRSIKVGKKRLVSHESIEALGNSEQP